MRQVPLGRNSRQQRFRKQQGAAPILELLG
jgi:hypothetical protein